MPTFDWVESPGTAAAPKANVAISQMGDGYEQRAPIGLHPITQIWNVVFADIDVAIADDIEAFLMDGYTWKTFDWMPPRQSVALKFKCTAFNRSIGSELDTHSITATFEQVFEP